MTNFTNMIMDESGASAAEYALILAIVGTAIAAAAFFLGNAIATSISETSQCLESNGKTCL